VLLLALLEKTWLTFWDSLLVPISEDLGVAEAALEDVLSRIDLIYLTPNVSITSVINCITWLMWYLMPPL
jgi:hypothetical protein